MTADHGPSAVPSDCAGARDGTAADALEVHLPDLQLESTT
jgi:hypothetical protein